MFYDSWGLGAFTCNVQMRNNCEQCLWGMRHVFMRDITQAFSLERCYLRDTKIFLWGIFLWAMLFERHNKYSFESRSFERCYLRDIKIFLIEMFLVEKTKIPFERYHLSCLSLRSTSYLLFETRQVFVWELSEYERIIWNDIKANPQSKFSMSNIRIEFLIVGAQSRLSRYTLKANSQSKPSKYKPNDRTLTK